MSFYSINTLDLLPGNSAQSASMISSAPLWLLCSLLKWRTTEIVHHNVCLQMCGPISYVLEIGHCHSMCNVGGVGCVCVCVRVSEIFGQFRRVKTAYTVNGWMLCLCVHEVAWRRSYQQSPYTYPSGKTLPPQYNTRSSECSCESTVETHH